MGTSTTTDVKRLLDLAVRMGIPATDALHQVREMSPEPDPTDRVDAANPTNRAPSA